MLFELNKFFVSKEKVYYLLATMHNLPRVYLGEDKETLCELKQISISESEAIDYAYRNMDKHLKEKYCNILKK